MPYLAALICDSAFDIALHDAYGELHRVDIYQTYNVRYLSRDLAHYLQRVDGAPVSFAGLYPADFFVACAAEKTAGLAPGGRTRPARPGRPDRPGAQRRVPGAAQRLDQDRRADLPEGQTAWH